MTKKEFKRLKIGDKLVVTGKTFIHFYPMGETVIVTDIHKKEKIIKCFSTIDGSTQRLDRKDLAIING